MRCSSWEWPSHSETAFAGREKVASKVWLERGEVASILENNAPNPLDVRKGRRGGELRCSCASFLSVSAQLALLKSCQCPLKTGWYYLWHNCGCILTSMPPLPVSQRLAATSCQMSINDQKARSCQSENLIAINCPTLTVGKHKITKPPFRGISPHLILRSCVFFFSPINMCLVQGQCGEAHTGSSITVTWLPPLLSIDQKSCTT